MNFNYCNENCPVGTAARDSFIRKNNSAYDALTDFRLFVENCAKTCTCPEVHRKLEDSFDKKEEVKLC